jgi:hypothetical protein
MQTKTKKIKKLEIKIPPKWKLAGYLYKPSKHKIYYQNYYRYAYGGKLFNDNNPLCSLNGKPVPNAFILKRILGKSVSTDWHIYKEALNKIRSKGYKQKVIILHL